MAPTRTCVGCRAQRPATELVRFHLASDGSIRLGRGEGRGAWLCPDLDCLDEAIRRRRFQRALRADIGPDSLAELAHDISARGFWPGSCQDGKL